MRYSVIDLPCTAENVQERMNSFLGHAVFGYLGLRPFFAQHTGAEHTALKRWAAGRSALVEIGVAEGVSAFAIREGMSEQATLFLVDPFHLSRMPALNFTRRAARRAVEDCKRGRVEWIEEFSYEAVKRWNKEIDFLLIDGDHSEAGVKRDWDDWSRFVAKRGVVVFHDARTFEGGWTSGSHGPVRLVNDLFRTGTVPVWKIVNEVDSLVVVERQV